MIPTPSTSHVPFNKVYEPAEDSFLLLDTLSSDAEKAFLQSRFNNHQLEVKAQSSFQSRSPFIIEIGSGSGVVISFVNTNCKTIMGRTDILTAGVDVNIFACRATKETVRIAENEQQAIAHGLYLGNILGDLTSFLQAGQVDILIFNPPYVASSELPKLLPLEDMGSFSCESHLLSLSYAGGVDGTETTNRLLNSLPQILSPERGCAYVLLCAQNKPEEIKNKVKNFGSGWLVKTVGQSGNYAGWEKLQIIRIWRT